MADIVPWTELAQILGVTRQSIFLWRKLPEAPDVADPERWKEFVAFAGLGVSGNRVSESREELLKANLEKKNRLLDLQIAKEERTVVDREDINSLLLHIAALAKSILYPALERELPPRAEGRTAVEIGILGREFADRICDQMARDIEVWAEK